MDAFWTWVRSCQRCVGAVPTTHAEPIVSYVTDTVPYRVSALFDRLDVDPDGKVDFDEWASGIAKEFPNLPEYAQAEVPRQFEKHALTRTQGGIVWKYLDKPHFSKMYAAFLFRNFDADNNGYLDVHEAEKALAYLSGGTQPVAIAFDPFMADKSNNDVRIHKPTFWAMYKKMMDE